MSVEATRNKSAYDVLPCHGIRDVKIVTEINDEAFQEQQAQFLGFRATTVYMGVKS